MKNNKEYDIIIYRALKYKNQEIYKNNLKNISKKEEFKDYFLNNVKKSSFLVQILPLFLFSTISLISFHVVILNQNNQKFTMFLKNENLLLPIYLYGLVFLIISLILIVQRLIFKTKVVSIYSGNKKGFYNISNTKYNEIINILKDEV